MRPLVTFLLLLAASLAAHAQDRRLDFQSDAYAYVQPGRPLTLAVYGREISSATLRFYPLPDLAGTLEEARGLPRGKAVRTLTVKLPRDDRHWVQHDVKLQPLPEGVYLGELESAAGRDYMVLAVSRLLLVSKVAPRELLVYGVDTTTGKPLAGVDVQVFHHAAGRRGARLDGGRTGPDGVLRLPLPTREDSYEVVGRLGRSANLSRVFFEPVPELRVYTTTDRPLYRPGHKVQYRTLVRRLPNGATDYENMPGQAVVVEVHDSTGSVLARTEGTTGPNGSFSGDYTLPGEPPLGQYSLVVRVGEESFHQPFKVEEYRKPEFTITLTPDRAQYVDGSTASVRVSAKYLFGSPVPGGRFTYELYADGFEAPPLPVEGVDDAYLSEPGLAEGRVVSGAGGGDFLLRGEGVLDPRGEAVISLPLKGPRRLWKLRLDVDVTDLSNRVQSASATAPVADTNFFLIAEAARDLYLAGDSVRVRVRAVGFDGKPVGTRFRVDLGRTDWVHGKYLFVTARRVQGSTDAARGLGEVVLPAPAQPGSYQVRVEAPDAGGRWVAAGGDSLEVTKDRKSAERARYPDLLLTLDRPMYRPGDTARLLVQTREATGVLMLTVEGERLHRHLQVPVRDHAARVDLKVERAYLPSLHLSGTLVPAREAPLFAHTEAIVRADEHFLDVQATPDRKEYRPGDTAQVTVRTRDAKGAPTPAEVSLAVVDEAVFALSPELAQPIRRYFWGPRENNVATVTSAVPVYRGGQFQTVGEPVKIRRVFRDTAYWNPAVETGPAGEVTLPVTLPDNLTTWRLTAVGATKDTSVGRSLDTALARQPFMVRLVTPRFLVRDDRTVVQTHVHNDTGVARSVRVDLAGQGLTVQGPATQTVQVPSGEVRVLDWTVAQPASTSGTLTARATTGSAEAEDGVETSLRGVPQGLAWVKAGAGVGSSAFVLDLPAQFDSQAGGLTVRLAPDVEAVVQGALRDLSSAKPDLTEEVASALLALAVAGQGGLQDRVATLYARQNNDGGWPWGPEGASEPFTSARAAEALAAARKAGVLVDEQRLQRAAYYLRSVPGNPGVQAGLARALGAAPASVDLAQLDYQAQALILQVAPSAEGGALLAGEATRLDGKAWWQTDPEKLGWTDGAVETTAEAVRALLLTRPDDPAIDEAVRWLLLARRGAGWASARATCAATLALREWLAARGDRASGSAGGLTVNGTAVPVPPAGSGEAVAFVPAASLKPGPNEIRVDGPLHSWELSVWPLGQAPASPADGGLAVRREYYRRIFEYDARGNLGFRYEPLKGPVKVGEEVLAMVKVVGWRRAGGLVLEDPLPAGFEARDETAADLLPKGYVRDYLTHVFFRDQKVVLYQDTVEPRLYQHMYLMRAERPGRYTLNPATVRLVYYPEIRGNSDGRVLEVVP